MARTGSPQQEDPTPTPTPLPSPRPPTECLRHEQADGSIKEYCTSENPEPIPASAKLDKAMQEAIAEYERQQKERADTPAGAASESEDSPYFPIIIYPNNRVDDAIDNLVEWLESLGYDPEMDGGTIKIYINYPPFISELSLRDDVEQVTDIPVPIPSVG